LKCSPATVFNARKQLAAEARKKARKPTDPNGSVEPRKAPRATPDKRERALRFLKGTLADGPMQVSDVESAAEKVHVDLSALEQARGDLGVVVSRANTGGVHAVQWSLPG
jgi:hypothetical protein